MCGRGEGATSGWAGAASTSMITPHPTQQPTTPHRGVAPALQIALWTRKSGKGQEGKGVRIARVRARVCVCGIVDNIASGWSDCRPLLKRTDLEFPLKGQERCAEATLSQFQRPFARRGVGLSLWFFFAAQTTTTWPSPPPRPTWSASTPQPRPSHRTPGRAAV